MAFVRVDVTAVKFHEDRIFSGIGSYTNIFSKGCLRLLQRIYTLKGQKIYGFVPSKCNRKVLCFGGKQFTVLNCPDSNDVPCVRVFEPVACDDWLHAAVWVDVHTVALLTAHNSVQFWDTTTQTLISQHESCYNSILYSGLLVPLERDVLVLAGTVFSDIILHCCEDSEPLQHLRGHRGVIFSISCNLLKKLIVTTSDDRSVRIWAANNGTSLAANTKKYWKYTTVTCMYELYGHSARVMRNCITNDFVISVGEDGAICFWSQEGKLLRKNAAHQNSSIWSVDADDNSLVTGGGDCGVMVHPLTLDGDYSHNVALENVGVKKVVITSRRNIVMMTDENLIYYNVENTEKVNYKLNHTSTYKLLSISPCKQIVAVADMNGNIDVFIENCKEDCLQNIITSKLQIEKVLSMHWGDNRHLILCSQSGIVTIVAKGEKLEIVCNFVLPLCKERWLTAAAVHLKKNMIILGDRCGNIHIYSKGKQDPVRTFRKVHGRYGSTSITIKDNEVISTGRDGTIRYFSVRGMEFEYMSSMSLEFQWVEKFLDRNEKIVCGFQERDFVVYDVRNNCRILEVACGGGHRSWDAVRYIDKVNEDYDEFIKLVYIKGSDAHNATFRLSKIVSRHVINGSHCKEINCLKWFASALDAAKPFYISGGEDTTVRLSSLDSKVNFVDRVLYKHLSNVRTLKLYKIENEKILIISAGGRAQIRFNILHFNKNEDEINVVLEEVLDYQVRGTDKEKKGNQNWRNCSIDFDPETRIMDVEAINDDDNDFLIFAGCSDAYLRIFKLNHKETMLKIVNELKYHNTCILKTHGIRIESEHMLVTTTTRGELAFWNVKDVEDKNFRPFFTTTTNKSGVNSVDSKVISRDEILIVTGGDDNALHLALIKLQRSLKSARLMCSVRIDTLHSSQITGVCFSDEFLMSTSIDQRVSLLKWKVLKGDISWAFVTQVFCDVADVQGMDLIKNSSETITACIFGKGMEVIKINTQDGNKTY